MNYLGRTLYVQVGKEIRISLIAGEELSIQVYQNVYELKADGELNCAIGNYSYEEAIGPS